MKSGRHRSHGPPHGDKELRSVSQEDPNRFTFTDADLERGARALLEAHDNPYESIPADERGAALANAQADVEAVLIAVGGTQQ